MFERIAGHWRSNIEHGDRARTNGATMASEMESTQRWDRLAESAHFNARELARLCNLSTRQLQREFRRVLGRTPQDWLNERRMVVAREMLLAGEPVKKVALDLGFKQISHFCRHFKTWHQFTASEFTSARREPALDAALRKLTSL